MARDDLAQSLAGQRAKNGPRGRRDPVEMTVSRLLSMGMTTPSRAALACGQSLTVLAELGERLDDEQWQRPTDCPEWTVGDIYAHVAGLEQWVAEGPAPYDGEMQKFIDLQVAQRSGMSRRQILDELRALIPVREGQLAQTPEQIYQPLLRRDVPAELFLEMRVFDLWVHEQDIRAAAGMPGGLSTLSAEVVRDMMVASLPRAVAKKAAAPAGSSVRLVVTGELPFDVTVVVGADGRASIGSSEAPDARLSLDWAAFNRLASGRGGGYPVEIEGDRELAGRVLAGLNIAP